MNRFVLATFALLLAAVTTGCNTVQGIGMDMQDAGHALKKAATPNSN